MLILIGLTALLMGAVASGAGNEANCPWFAFHYSPGSSHILLEERKEFEAFLKTVTDKKGKIRIYGASPYREKGETPAIFRKRVAEVRKLVANWLKKHPRWVLHREARLPASDQIQPRSIEIEFHGYDDPRRHEKPMLGTKGN